MRSISNACFELVRPLSEKDLQRLRDGDIDDDLLIKMLSQIQTAEDIKVLKSCYHESIWPKILTTGNCHELCAKLLYFDPENSHSLLDEIAFHLKPDDVHRIVPPYLAIALRDRKPDLFRWLLETYGKSIIGKMEEIYDVKFKDIIEDSRKLVEISETIKYY